ncbi:GL25201 [Drosophila persimilis]|uniref:GL25201 n=1 Tax=Drosophila persimilis TaxID=7234 RepID=B4GU53_DROPE|nr:GL25201 [Drosophila persimilis]
MHFASAKSTLQSGCEDADVDVGGYKGSCTTQHSTRQRHVPSPGAHMGARTTGVQSPVSLSVLPTDRGQNVDDGDGHDDGDVDSGVPLATLL